MTDKARELLERTLKQLNPWHPGMGEQQFDYTLREEIRAYLAEPEVKREPLHLNDVVKAFFDSEACENMDNFIAGVLFAEKHHGIGGDDDKQS